MEKGKIILCPNKKIKTTGTIANDTQTEKQWPHETNFSINFPSRGNLPILSLKPSNKRDFTTISTVASTTTTDIIINKIKRNT